MILVLVIKISLGSVGLRITNGVGGGLNSLSTI